MRVHRGVLRRLPVVGVALATVVRHTGVSGTCADRAPATAAPTAMATGHQDQPPSAPGAPAGLHAMAGGVCQAPLPSRSPWLPAAATAPANTGSAPGTDHSSSTPPAPSASASAPVGATHNAADVSFTQNTIVHHRGAVEMAELATTQASSQQVKDLAVRVEAAQGPEITESGPDRGC